MAEEQNNIRSKVKREQAEESISNCHSEATSMEAFMFNPLKQNGGGSVTEVAVSDEPFSPTGSVQSSHQINNFGVVPTSVPLSMVQLASYGTGSGSFVMPTGVAAEHQHNQAEAPSPAVLSKALDDQVEALKKKICEKIQLRMQMNQQHQEQQQQQQDVGYQMSASTLMPSPIMHQSGRGLYCCAAPLGAVVALPQGSLPQVSQETSQYGAIMAANGSHYPVQQAPGPILTAPPTADFGSFTSSTSNAGLFI